MSVIIHEHSSPDPCLNYAYYLIECKTRQCHRNQRLNCHFVSSRACRRPGLGERADGVIRSKDVSKCRTSRVTFRVHVHCLSLSSPRSCLCVDIYGLPVDCETGAEDAKRRFRHESGDGGRSEGMA